MSAWEALPAIERLHLDAFGDDRQARRAEQRRLASFRAWWRVGYIQYLMNVSRLRDFRTQTSLFEVDESDPPLRAEYTFLRGMGEETMARLSDQPAGPVRGQGATLDGRAPAITLALRSARTWYRRTLAAAPQHPEARLRLGRVLLEQREIDDAVQVLTPLTSNPCTAIACGLAWLFIGEAREAAGTLPQAGAAYSRAASLLGTRQSALLALMTLAVRRGDIAAAYGLTAQLSTTSLLSSLDSADAWSIYVGGRRLDGEAVLAPLRDAAAQ